MENNENVKAVIPFGENDLSTVIDLICNAVTHVNISEEEHLANLLEDFNKPEDQMYFITKFNISMILAKFYHDKKNYDKEFKVLCKLYDIFELVDKCIFADRGNSYDNALTDLDFMKLEFMLIHQIGWVYYYSDDEEMAIHAFKTLLDLEEKMKTEYNHDTPIFWMTSTKKGLGLSFFELNNFVDAKKLLTESNMLVNDIDTVDKLRLIGDIERMIKNHKYCEAKEIEGVN